MKFSTVFLLITISLPVFGRELKLKISLSPAGEFVVQSNKVRGFISKEDDTYSAKEIYIEVGNFKTGIDLRDKHFQERLGGPVAKIIVKDATGANGKGQATLEVNKISHPIQFEFKENNNAIQATFIVKPSDYNIKDISYLGIGVQDRVVIDASIPIQ